MKIVIYILSCVILILSLTSCTALKLDFNPFDDGKIGVEMDIEEIIKAEEKKNSK